MEFLEAPEVVAASLVFKMDKDMLMDRFSTTVVEHNNEIRTEKTILPDGTFYKRMAKFRGDKLLMDCWYKNGKLHGEYTVYSGELKNCVIVHKEGQVIDIKFK